MTVLKRYTEFYSIKLQLKFAQTVTGTCSVLQVLSTMVELTTPYFSHFPHGNVSKKQRFPYNLNGSSYKLNIVYQNYLSVRSSPNQ